MSTACSHTKKKKCDNGSAVCVACGYTSPAKECISSNEDVTCSPRFSLACTENNEFYYSSIISVGCPSTAPLVVTPPHQSKARKTTTTTVDIAAAKSEESCSQGDKQPSLFFNNFFDNLAEPANLPPVPTYSDSVLCEDIFATMCSKENQKWPLLQEQQRQQHQKLHYLRCRPKLLQWVEEVAEVYHLNHVTLHTAVYYIDKILLNFAVQASFYQLVAICCVVLAVKMEEVDLSPSAHDLNNCAANAYTYELIVLWEKKCLQALNWELVAITPSQFLGFYLHKMQVETHDTFQRYARLFSDLHLQENQFLYHTPSLIAASAIATARRVSKMDTWPQELQQLTGYSFKDVSGLYNIMFNYYRHCTSSNLENNASTAPEGDDSFGSQGPQRGAEIPSLPMNSNVTQHQLQAQSRLVNVE